MPKFAVKVIRATSLSLAQGKPKPEAYVKLTLGTQPKQKTKIIKGFDPVWNEWFDFDRWNQKDKLVIEVKHSNTLNTNVNLGKYVVDFPTDKTGHTKSKVALSMDKIYNKRGNQSYLEFEIINVAIKQQQAAMQYSVSNEKGEELIRKMMQGSDWTMYSEKGGKMKTREVNLFYCSDTADGYPIGSIIWTAGDNDGCPKPADVSDKHVLAVHTLTDIYIGSPCPHVSAVKSGIDKDLLMTFKGEKQFDFVCSTDKIVDDWIKGLRYAIVSKGKKVANVDVGGVGSGESKKAATSWDHPANDTVQQMLDGFDMVAYFDISKPRKENVFVWYSRKGGKYGSIYYSNGGKRENPSKCIYLHQLTDIYVGKQQKIFQGPIASDVEDQCCFSVVSKRSSKRIELHLQAQSVAVMKSWMVGINHILTTTGRKVVLESETGEKKTTAKGRRFSRHFSVAVRAKSTHPGVLKMADGAYFTRYRQKKSKKDRSVKTQVFVFHSRLGGKNDAGNSATGALFWYEKADKDKEVEDRKKDRRCIPVHSITDIYCGKQHEIFKTKVANESKENCTFSIKGVEVSKGNKENFLLHLEAESPEIVKTWMDAIAHLLQGGGRSVEQVGEDQSKKSQEGQSSEGISSPSGTDRGKRLSVAPPTSDPLDMFGFDAVVTEPNSEDIGGMFPASRPANPFDDAQGGWDPFADAPAPAPPSDDLSAFFGDPQPTSPTSPTSPKVGEVPVLFPGQDSVWGSEGVDPFGSSAPPTDTPSTQSDPFGAPDDFGQGSTDPFGTTGGTDPFSTPGETDPFAAPPTESKDTSPDFGDIFGAPPPQSTPSYPAPQEGMGEMTRFLMSIGLQKFAKKFEEEQVDMESLKMFSKDDLKDMGLPTGPAIKILKSLPNWKG